MPLVVVLHGGGVLGDPVPVIRRATRFDAKADREGAIVLYPEAVEQHWNDGRGLSRYRSQRDNIDDVGFISALIDRVAAALPVDRRRVYLTGASNGAMMAYRLACERPSRFAAVAAVIGNLPASLSCAPDTPVPMLIMNGTADPLMPWAGGDVHFGRQRLGRVRSAEETVARWVAIDGCRGVPSVEPLPDRAPRDGTRVVRTDYGRCAHGSEVVFYRVEGGGHTWPGGPQETGRLIVGRTSRDIDATDAIWNFFVAHAG